MGDIVVKCFLTLKTVPTGMTRSGSYLKLSVAIPKMPRVPSNPQVEAGRCVDLSYRSTPPEDSP